MKKKGPFFALATRIVKHPNYSLFLGLVLMSCGILEGVETALEDFFDVDVAGHHGMVIFGFGAVLKALADLLEGSSEILVTEEVAMTMEQRDGKGTPQAD